MHIVSVRACVQYYDSLGMFVCSEHIVAVSCSMQWKQYLPDCTSDSDLILLSVNLNEIAFEIDITAEEFIQYFGVV